MDVRLKFINKSGKNIHVLDLNVPPGGPGYLSANHNYPESAVIVTRGSVEVPAIVKIRWESNGVIKESSIKRVDAELPPKVRRGSLHFILDSTEKWSIIYVK